MDTFFASLLKVLSFIGSLIGDFFSALIDAFEKKQGFNAEFGSEGDVASRFNKGFLISKHRKLTRRQSFENVLLAGPTGSGKTTRLLLKNLYTLKNCSLIINDPSKELYFKASGYMAQYFNLLTLNFSDSSMSSGYNLLSRVKKPSDVHKIAAMLVATTIGKNASDPFWSLQAKSLLSLFIRLVMYQEPHYQNMANVLHLLNLFAAEYDRVDRLVAGANDEKLLLDYKSFVAMPEKTLMNVVASGKAALEIFEDPEIARVTAHDSIDFDTLRLYPFALFIHNSISDQKYVSVLNSIFFEQLYGHFLNKLPAKSENDLFIIMEEASSMYIPTLPIAISNTRKHRIGNLICVQTPGQLSTYYKDDSENITANCVTKIFLPGQTSMDVLRDIEALSGKTTYVDKKGIEKVKSLVTIDEIRQLHKNRVLILSGNHPLIKGRTSPYFNSLIYSSYSNMEPMPLTGDIPPDPIAYL